MELNDKLKKIRAFVFDVDGVLTDGKILAMGDGDLLRQFDAKDAFGLRMANMNGYHLGIITGGRSESIVKRVLSCGVPRENIYLGARDKMVDFRDFCRKNGLEAEEVMYFGDDIPDLAVVKACGCGVAPADAIPDLVAAADYVSPYGGGNGCVRHALEMVMRLQDRWQLDVDLYASRF